MHAFGKHQVGDRIHRIGERIELSADGRRLCPGNGGAASTVVRQAGDGIRIVASVHIVEEVVAVDHVARLHRFRRRAGGNVGQLAGGEWEALAQHVDVLIELDARMILVQAALELVAQKRGELLSVAQALDIRHRHAHAARRQIHRHQIGARGLGVRKIRIAQHCGRHRVR